MALKDLTVTKLNSLIEARYKLSLIEQRVVLACVALSDPRGAMAATISINADQFSQIYNCDIKNSYKHLKMSADSLPDRTIIIEDDELVFHKASWVSEAKYHKKEGRLQLWFSPSIQRYLSQIKRKFTHYELRRIAQLNSNYSIRLFELLIRFNDTGQRVVSISKLREQMGLSPELYPRFPDFRKRVLDAAIKDLHNNTNLVIEYSSIKNGRKITALEFTFFEAAQQNLPLNSETNLLKQDE